MPSTRVQAVAACVLLVLSGCIGTPTTPTKTSTTASPEAPTATATSTTGAPTPASTTPPQTTDTTHDRCIRGDVYRVDASAVARETAIRVTSLDRSAARIVNETIENGSTTVTTVESVFSGGEYPIRVGETYYDLNRSVLDTEEVTVHLFRVGGPIDSDDPEYERATSEAVAVENLSPPDRRVFERGMPSDEKLAGIARFTRGVSIHFENGTAPTALTLDAERTRYVAYEGEYYAVEFRGTDRTDRVTYRYTSTRLADSRSAYVDISLKRYVTNVSNASLSAGAREILLGGIENGSVYYHSEDPYIATDYKAFYQWSLDHRFVEYNGDYYRLDSRKVME